MDLPEHSFGRSERLGKHDNSWYQRSGKRLFDIAVSGIALVTLAPLLAGVGLVVRFTMGRPVLFRQLRPGQYERPFNMLKFRTMRNASGPDGRPLPDQVRVTRVGAVLRKTSLDELPELFNVLRGDMSLVGPRPLLIEYLPHYSEEERQRHQVRPGVTGLAQVQLRNRGGWEERFVLDLDYARAISFRRDLGILWRSVASVLSAKDVEVVPGLRGSKLDVERSAKQGSRDQVMSK